MNEQAANQNPSRNRDIHNNGRRSDLDPRRTGFRRLLERAGLVIKLYTPANDDEQRQQEERSRSDERAGTANRRRGFRRWMKRCALEFTLFTPATDDKHGRSDNLDANDQVGDLRRANRGNLASEAATSG